jgi:hypothetical protein
MKKLLDEYFSEHPHVTPGKKKKKLTEAELKERNDRRRQQQDKAKNRRGW